jgi:hypothetical protein
MAVLVVIVVAESIYSFIYLAILSFILLVIIATAWRLCATGTCFASTLLGAWMFGLRCILSSWFVLSVFGCRLGCGFKFRTVSWRRFSDFFLNEVARPFMFAVSSWLFFVTIDQRVHMRTRVDH